MIALGADSAGWYFLSMTEAIIAELIRKSGGFEHIDRKVASFVGYRVTKNDHQEIAVDILAFEIDGKTLYRCVASSGEKRSRGDHAPQPTIVGTPAYVRWDLLE